jgi:V/A-type H+-transporting ATPase subunit E
MKTLEDSQTKIQNICKLLKEKTLLPAKEEASEILEEARVRAAEIIADAEKQAQEHLASARHSIEQERNIFQSSLVQASKQSLEALRQAIENKMFNDELHALLHKQMANPEIVANLIKAIITALEKDGLDTDITALIPKTMSIEEVNKLLGDGIIKKLKTHSVTVGAFNGGAQMRLHGKNMALDISENTLKELLSTYVRKDFRKLIFGC